MISHTPEPNPNRPTPHSHGDIALNYQARWGLNVIPGYPETKEPFKGGWGHRLHLQAMSGEPIDPSELAQFWESQPEANILMFPGAVSGVDVIDVDTKTAKKSGFETLREYGLDWVTAEALRVYTPTSNGVHLYFKHTVDSPNKKPPGTGLELFCAGNQYVVMPPSIYKDSTTGEYGFYTCNDFNLDGLNLDGLNPVPQDLVNFFMEKGLNSPVQRQSGYRPSGEFGTLPPINPPPGTLITVPTSTLKTLGLESQRKWREANSLKHLAKNTEFRTKVREWRAEVIHLNRQGLERNLLQQALNRIEEEAHSMLSRIDKKRRWFLIAYEDGTVNGWIFKLHGRWHWVGIPGTKHDGIEIKPTPEELASKNGKGKNKYIIRNDGSIIVQFIHHSQSGKSSKVGWYYLYEGEYPELDEFI